MGILNFSDVDQVQAQFTIESEATQCTPGTHNDSAGIGDMLQVLPEALKDAVETYLSASQADARDGSIPRFHIAMFDLLLHAAQVRIRHLLTVMLLHAVL